MRMIPFIFSCTMLFYGCSKNNGPGGGDNPESEEPGTPAVTAKGAPDGSAPAEKTIGAAGGTLTSIDGQLTLTVPAGAFTANQNVSIQRISNLNPAAAGHAYRLLPEGVTFVKPVSITFRYQDSDSTFFDPESLGGSYQKANGTWTILPGTVDAPARTVTVQTTHFSDWSIVGGVGLTISQPALPIHGRCNLTVKLHKPTKDSLIYLPLTLPNSQIKEWKIVKGAGRLVLAERNDNPVIYEAPSVFPRSPNDLVVISVKVQPDPKNPKTKTLTGKIRIVEGLMLLKINDGDDMELIASPAVNEDGIWHVQGHSKDWKTTVVLQWPRGIGNHAFSLDPLKANPAITVNHNGNTYGFLYSTKDAVLPSPGGIHCTSLGDDDGYVKGNFRVDKAGLPPDLKYTAKIEGSFATPQY